MEASELEISVISAVYECESTLNELVHRLHATLSEITDRYEIILVDDGSKDHSWDRIQDAAKFDGRVRGIRLTRNFGEYRAFTAGLDHCQGNWAVLINADLQDPPEEIDALYTRALQGFEVVTALRRGNSRWLRRIASRLYGFMFRSVSSHPYDWRLGNFRILSSRVVGALRGFREELRHLEILIDWMNFPSTTISVDYLPRPSGRSAYSVKRLAYLGLDAMVAYVERPYSVWMVLSFITFVLFGLLTFGAGWFGLFNPQYAPLPFLLVLVTLAFGVILFGIAIVMVYAVHSYHQSRDRPLYLICEQTNSVYPPPLPPPYDSSASDACAGGVSRRP